MTRTTAVRLLIAQSVVAIALFWALLYYGRDEFRLAVHHEDAAIPSTAQVGADDDGPPVVRLTIAAQRNVGLELAAPQVTSLAAESSMQAVVVDAQPLLEARARLQAARLEVEAAATAEAASAAEARRVRALYADDRNASQRAVEAAQAQAAVDATRRRAAEVALTGLRSTTRLAWGSTVAGWAEAADGAAVQRIATGQDALLRLVLRPGESVGSGSALRYARAGDARLVSATSLGPAGGDVTAGGRALMYRAPGAGLAAGQRLGVSVGDGTAAQRGLLIPPQAVVWHDGQPWVYVVEASPPATDAAPVAGKTAAPKDDDDGPPKPAVPAVASPASAAASGAAPAAAAPASAAAAFTAFQRRALLQARRVGDDWFLPTADTDDAIVVRGAQLLLSQEQKSLIKNENDD